MICVETVVCYGKPKAVCTYVTYILQLSTWMIMARNCHTFVNHLIHFDLQPSRGSWGFSMFSLYSPQMENGQCSCYTKATSRNMKDISACHLLFAACLLFLRLRSLSLCKNRMQTKPHGKSPNAPSLERPRWPSQGISPIP